MPLTIRSNQEISTKPSVFPGRGSLSRCHFEITTVRVLYTPNDAPSTHKRIRNRLCATRISTVSVFPASTFLPTLNPIEPPWYGPVCPVVWEGWREVSPYPDLSAQ